MSFFSRWFQKKEKDIVEQEDDVVINKIVQKEKNPIITNMVSVGVLSEIVKKINNSEEVTSEDMASINTLNEIVDKITTVEKVTNDKINKEIKPNPNPILHGFRINSPIVGATNFTVNELIRSETALRNNIENTPTKAQLNSLVLVSRKILQPVRNQFGRTTVTSGFRSVQLCVAIGSWTGSAHAKGEAVDFYCRDKNVNLMVLTDWIYKNLEFRELILELDRGVIHCSFRQGGNLKMLKVKTVDKNYEKITIVNLRKFWQELK